MRANPNFGIREKVNYILTQLFEIQYNSDFLQHSGKFANTLETIFLLHFPEVGNTLS